MIFDHGYHGSRLPGSSGSLAFLPFQLLRPRDFLLPIFDATGQTVAKVACTGERMALLKGWLAELFVASDFPAIGQRGYQLL